LPGPPGSNSAMEEPVEPNDPVLQLGWALEVGSVTELIEELASATFSQEHWTQLELGTRDLRTLLGNSNEIDSDLAVSIHGYIAELRRILEEATSPLATPRQISIACYRAEDLRRRILTLLRP
jgi:hypothetical protein